MTKASFAAHLCCFQDMDPSSGILFEEKMVQFTGEIISRFLKTFQDSYSQFLVSVK